MPYELTQITTQKIQYAIANATAIREADVTLRKRNKLFVFLKFNSPIELAQSDDKPPALIDTLFAGDACLTDSLATTQQHDGIEKVEASLRWQGIPDLKRRICATGLSLSLTVSKRFQCNLSLGEQIVQVLSNERLIDETAVAGVVSKLVAALNQRSPLIAGFSQHRHCNFFAKPITEIAADDSKPLEVLLTHAQAYIRENIPPTNPKYIHAGEEAINPAFENITQVSRSLHLNENRIWILRSDFVLALGLKNAYRREFGYTGLEEAFAEENHQYINWRDRYGHPSLTLPDEGYCGGAAYYAGYLAQRDGYIEVLLFSGRYHRDDLNATDTAVLESYVSSQFQQAFGQQPIIFVENSSYKNYWDLSVYLSNQPLPEDFVRRQYTADSIAECLQNSSRKSDNAGLNVSVGR